MSETRFLASSGPEVISAVLSALRADADLQSVLGQPARVYDDETDAPVYPYALLERHETSGNDGVNKRGLEHTLHFATYSRYGGMEAAKRLIGLLRGAVEDMSLDGLNQRVVLILPTYSDVLRTKSANIFRGVLRVRLYAEEL
jgi:hypothetical protein